MGADLKVRIGTGIIPLIAGWVADFGSEIDND
jgi:hypothetical protein